MNEKIMKPERMADERMKKLNFISWDYKQCKEVYGELIRVREAEKKLEKENAQFRGLLNILRKNIYDLKAVLGGETD